MDERRPICPIVIVKPDSRHVLAELEYIHRFLAAQAGPDAPVLLLLHGTGGDEEDLLPLARALAPDASLLSPRGKVLENGAPRFFRRLGPGVFDLDDLRLRADELVRFVAEASSTYGFNPARVTALGYSNGANMAAAMLLLHPGALRAAALLHAMLPIHVETIPDLTGTRVFLSGGRTDRMVPPEGAEELERTLRAAGADVEMHWEPGGHVLNQGELTALSAWLSRSAPERTG